jgi:cytochrome c551/c552
MYRYFLIVITMVSFGFFCPSSHSSATDGEALFEALKCGACHRPSQKTVAVPLVEIARTYEDQSRLVSFFKGEGPFLIESTKSGMMKGQMKRLETLSEADKKALADYVQSFK